MQLSLTATKGLCSALLPGLRCGLPLPSVQFPARVFCVRRYAINPPHDAGPVPKSRVIVELMRKAGVSEVLIPAGPAQNVLGPHSAASVAQRLRAALVMRPRQPDFGEVPGLTPDTKVWPGSA